MTGVLSLKLFDELFQEQWRRNEGKTRVIYSCNNLTLFVLFYLWYSNFITQPIYCSLCNIYRAHTKYDAKVMFSAFLSFCSQGGGGLKIEKCSECHGKPKKGGGGGGGSLVLTLSTRCATRGGGGGRVLSFNFVHQMCHQGGGRGGSNNQMTPPSPPPLGHSHYGCARYAIEIRIASLLSYLVG